MRLQWKYSTVIKLGKGEIGNLRIGFGGSVVFDILPQIIQLVHSKYPNLKLIVQQLTTSQQINALINGDIDVGILVPPIGEPLINVLPILQEEFVVCLNKEHPLAKDEGLLNISSFKEDNIIMTPYEAGTGYYESIMSLCKIGGFEPKITQTAQEQHTIVSLVASGIGIAFVPSSTAKINHENIVYREIEEKVYKETAVAWNIGDDTPSVRLFLSIIKDNII